MIEMMSTDTHSWLTKIATTMRTVSDDANVCIFSTLIFSAS